MLTRKRFNLALAGLLCAFTLPWAPTARAAGPAHLDTVRLGLLHTLSPAPLYIAKERGYFRDEGIDLKFRFFDAAQPIAAAAVSGDIDVGVTALTGGFFNLAEKGTLEVIGGALHEERGYQGSAVMASDKAYAAGLTSLKKLPGHTVAITQYGSSFHYMMGQVAAAEGFDLKSVTLRPVQTFGNMVAAVTTNQVDATILIASVAKPVAAAGKAHILGWVGDIAPYQITALFTTPAMVKNKADLLRRFAAAYKRGVADYRAAFLRRDAAGHPIYDAKTDAAIKLITKYVFTGDPNARQKILNGAGYYDANGALDVADVKKQIAWFKAQGLVKGNRDPNTMMTTEFLPAR